MLAKSGIKIEVSTALDRLQWHPLIKGVQCENSPNRAPWVFSKYQQVLQKSPVAKGSKMFQDSIDNGLGDYFQQMYDFAIDLIKPSRHASGWGSWTPRGWFGVSIGTWLSYPAGRIIISKHVKIHILIIMFGVSSVSILEAGTCWNYFIILVWRTSGELAHELPIPPREWSSRKGSSVRPSAGGLFCSAD